MVAEDAAEGVRPASGSGGDRVCLGARACQRAATESALLSLESAEQQRQRHTDGGSGTVGHPWSDGETGGGHQTQADCGAVRARGKRWGAAAMVRGAQWRHTAMKSRPAGARARAVMER